jgi:hypothetical protein
VRHNSQRTESEWPLLHPDVQEVVIALDSWTRAKGWPEVVVTDVLRTRAEQEALYWKSIMAAKKCTEFEARKSARSRFSWHMCFCAADLRDSHYTSAQLDEVVRWLRAHREPPMWEILDHTVGAGRHLHVARRGFDWRTRHTPKE